MDVSAAFRHRRLAARIPALAGGVIMALALVALDPAPPARAESPVQVTHTIGGQFSIAVGYFTTCPFDASRPDGTRCVDTRLMAVGPRSSGAAPANVSFFQITYLWPNVLLPFESAVFGTGQGTLDVAPNMSAARVRAELDLQECSDIFVCSSHGRATASGDWQATGPLRNALPELTGTVHEFLVVTAGPSQSRLATAAIALAGVPAPGGPLPLATFLGQGQDVRVSVTFGGPGGTRTA